MLRFVFPSFFPLHFLTLCYPTNSADPTISNIFSFRFTPLKLFLVGFPMLNAGRAFQQSGHPFVVPFLALRDSQDEQTSTHNEFQFHHNCSLAEVELMNM